MVIEVISAFVKVLKSHGWCENMGRKYTCYMDDSHVGGGVKSAIWIMGNNVLDLRMITYSSENGQPTNLFIHADSGHGPATMRSKPLWSHFIISESLWFHEFFQKLFLQNWSLGYITGFFEQDQRKMCQLIVIGFMHVKMTQIN